MDQETPSVPIFQTSTFRFGSSEEYARTIAFERPGYTYSRGYGNPTLDAFESQMASSWSEPTPRCRSRAGWRRCTRCSRRSPPPATEVWPQRRSTVARMRSSRRSCRATGSAWTWWTPVIWTRWRRRCRARRSSMSRRSRTPPCRLPTCGRSARSAGSTTCRRSSTTRSPRRTCATPRATGSTTWCIPRRSTSEGTTT